jgi:predicted ABC-type ATPase
VTTAVLHVLAGPNGAGKTTFVERVLQPATHLPFVNADVIATERWPHDTAVHAYEASDLAAQQRFQLLDERASFITETVFSHPSKLDLIKQAVASGYLVHLHAILVPEDVSVDRVAHRVQRGGHDVPEGKTRQRYRRLWDLVAAAVPVADRTTFYDNSRALTPYRVVAAYERGRLIGTTNWPAWTPAALRAPAESPP